MCGQEKKLNKYKYLIKIIIILNKFSNVLLSFLNLGSNFWMVSGGFWGGSYKRFLGICGSMKNCRLYIFDFNILIKISGNTKKKSWWGKCFYVTFHNNKYPLYNEEGNVEEQIYFC